MVMEENCIATIIINLALTLQVFVKAAQLVCPFAVFDVLRYYYSSNFFLCLCYLLVKY